MEHKCPVRGCGQLCDCENQMLYGDCTHDCDSWKANVDGASKRDWNGAVVAQQEED